MRVYGYGMGYMEWEMGHGAYDGQRDKMMENRGSRVEGQGSRVEDGGKKDEERTLKQSGAYGG